jgi:hypothetical protein
MYFVFPYKELMLKYEDKTRWLELYVFGHVEVSKSCMCHKRIRGLDIVGGWSLMEYEIWEILFGYPWFHRLCGAKLEFRCLIDYVEQVRFQMISL